MNTSTDFWIAFVSAALVFSDAKRRQLKHPLLWGGAVLIFWIAVLPVYLWRRLSSET